MKFSLPLWWRVGSYCHWGNALWDLQHMIAWWVGIRSGVAHTNFQHMTSTQHLCLSWCAIFSFYNWLTSKVNLSLTISLCVPNLFPTSSDHAQIWPPQLGIPDALVSFGYQLVLSSGKDMLWWNILQLLLCVHNNCGWLDPVFLCLSLLSTTMSTTKSHECL